MFDVNPDAAKYHFRDLERQVAASRRPRGIPHRPVERTISKRRSASLITACGRLSVRVFASAVRGVVAVVF